MSIAPIGIFDSGLGGLTTVKELQNLLPNENIVYFGDTGRVPYGSRGKDTIISYAKQDIAFLLSKKVKAIIAACGTVSSTLPPEVPKRLPVPYTGVVNATAAAAVKATKNNRIGIIGTEATVNSGSYQAALHLLSNSITSTAAACPLFVPLVESGHFAAGDPLATLAAKEYLAPMHAAGVDTLILGCTHYPLLADIIAAEMPSGTVLIDAGKETAKTIRSMLEKANLLSASQKIGTAAYYVSDDPARFGKLANFFLGEFANGTVQRVSIEDFSLPF